VVDLGDLRRVVSAVLAAVLLVLMGLDAAASPDRFALTSSVPLAVLDDDGSDLDGDVGAGPRKASGDSHDGSAPASEQGHLGAPSPSASGRLAPQTPRAVHLYRDRPQTATGPPRGTCAAESGLR